MPRRLAVRSLDRESFANFGFVVFVGEGSNLWASRPARARLRLCSTAAKKLVDSPLGKLSQNRYETLWG
jgi:hypothetical protein